MRVHRPLHGLGGPSLLQLAHGLFQLMHGLGELLLVPGQLLLVPGELLIPGRERARGRTRDRARGLRAQLILGQGQLLLGQIQLLRQGLGQPNWKLEVLDGRSARDLR